MITPFPGKLLNLRNAVHSLLYLRVLIFTSWVRRSNRKGKIRFTILVIFILVLVGVAGFLAWKAIDFFGSLQWNDIIQGQTELRSLLEILSSLPVVIITSFFFLMLIANFGVMLQILYLSNDLDFLLTKPLPAQAIFLSKMIQAVLPNFSIACLFFLPILFILGYIWQFHFSYYVSVVVLLLALAMTAGGMASLLVMFVVRIIPARRIAEVLGFLGAIFSILCSQTGQFARVNNISENQAQDLLLLASRFDLPWSPLSWAGRGLVALGNQEWMIAGRFLSIVLVGTILIFFLSMRLSEKLYYTGWASLQGVSVSKKRRREKRQGSSEERAVEKKSSKPFFFIGSFIPSPVSGIVLKDSLVLRRDLRNLSQLVTPLIIGVVYTLLLLRSGENPFMGSGNAPEAIQQGLRSLSVFVNVFISLFVSWTLLSRLAGMAFSQEGKSYWIIKSAPVKPSLLVISKYVVAYLPTLVLSSVFLLFISILRTDSLRLLPFTFPVVALLIAGNCGLNLAFGIAGTRMDWEDPRQMQRFLPGCLGTLATFIFLPLNLLFYLGPVLLSVMLGFPEGIGWLIGLSLGGVISLGFAVFPILIVINKVNSFAES